MPPRIGWMIRELYVWGVYADFDFQAIQNAQTQSDTDLDYLHVLIPVEVVQKVIQKPGFLVNFHQVLED